MDINEIWNTIVDKIINFGPRLLIALIVAWVGFKLINYFVSRTKKRMLKKGMEVPLVKFLNSAMGIGLKALLLIILATQLGFQSSVILAAIGALAFGVGLALQGNLGNLASGIVILFLKPFRIGDLVEVDGKTGVVEDILLFNTIIISPQNKKIIIPNTTVTGGTVTNISEKGTIRLDLQFGISYEDDIPKAKAILNEIVSQSASVLKDPPPTIAVNELADSSVNFACLIWANTPDYWDVYFDMHEKVKMRFDQEGISIPYPQMDVHKK